MKIKNPFFFGLMASLTVFAILTIVFVIWATTLSWGLESETYYDDEIAYQDQIERMKRASALHEKIVIKQANMGVEISFPESFMSNDLEGSIILFRPSDHTLDKKYGLSLDREGRFHIPSSDMPLRGLWRIKILWKVEGLEYFIQKNVYLN